MKAGWTIKPLGEVCEILDRLRKPITKSDRQAGPYPYYGATGVLDHVSGYLFDEPLVLVGEDGAKWEAGANSAFSVSGKVWVNNHAHVIRPRRSKVFDDWLIYFLNASDLMPFVSGMTVPKLNQGRLREIPIPLPPLEEQERIVAILDEAFEGLARARAHAEANLQNARELFACTLSQIFSRAPDWPYSTIGQIGQVFDGPHATPKTVEKGPLFLGISSLVDGRIELAKSRHVTEEDFVLWTKRVTPRGGDVVFSYETRLGQVALIPDGMKCCLGRRMGLVRLNKSEVDPEYFVLCYLSPEFQSFLRKKTNKGATVDRLSIKDFPGFPFPTPPLDIQAEVVEKVYAIRDQLDLLVERAETKLQSLDALRQSVLQKAFAGELT